MMDQEKNALNLAVKLLSGQDYAKIDLIQKLEKKGIPEEISHSVLKTLEKKNLYKEEYYIRSFVRKKIKKGVTPHLIKKELEKKDISISAQEMNDIISELGINPNKELILLLRSKIPSSFESHDLKQKEKVKNKLLRFALSKGVDFDQAIEIINSLLSRDEEV